MRKLLLFLFLIPGISSAQEAEQIIEERIEWISQELEGEELDLTTLTELYQEFYINKLNLNNFDKDQLAQLYLLSPDEIRAIIWHRINYGDFESVYELKAVNGLSLEKAILIAPFVTASPREAKPDSWKYRLKSAKYARHQLILRGQRILEPKAGYDFLDPKYEGDPNRLYARYRLRKSDLFSFGVTAEKDPGERFEGRGFDFYSAHLMLENIGPMKRLIVGDYQAQFGQALTMWTGFGFRKSPMQVLQTQRYARGLLPYTSTDENNFLRGVAAQFEWKQFNLHAFYSKKRIDANVNLSDTLADEQVQTFRSIQSSGFHRNLSEREDKDAIEEEIVGAVIEYKLQSTEIGVVNYMTRYSSNFQRNLSLYNQFEFDSSFNFVSGIYYRSQLGSVGLYGEASRSINGGLAALQGFSIPFHERLKFNAYHRHFQPNYQNLLSNALSEKSRITNESGTYFSLEFQVLSKLKMQGFADFYRFPWLSYRIDAPSRGQEYSLMLQYNFSRSVQLLALYRFEDKLENSSSQQEAVRTVVNKSLQQIRLQLDVKVNRQWSLRNRVAIRDYQKEGLRSQGFGLFQDLYYSSPSGRWSAKFRYAVFQTDSYDARIYAYEHDLLYQFSVPAYDGQGFKAYLLLRWKPTDFLRWEMRISRLERRDVDQLGSGNELIDAPHRTEVKSQLIFTF